MTLRAAVSPQSVHIAGRWDLEMVILDPACHCLEAALQGHQHLWVLQGTSSGVRRQDTGVSWVWCMRL